MSPTPWLALDRSQNLFYKDSRYAPPEVPRKRIRFVISTTWTKLHFKRGSSRSASSQSRARSACGPRVSPLLSIPPLLRAQMLLSMPFRPCLSSQASGSTSDCSTNARFEVLVLLARTVDTWIGSYSPTGFSSSLSQCHPTYVAQLCWCSVAAEVTIWQSSWKCACGFKCYSSVSRQMQRTYFNSFTSQCLSHSKSYVGTSWTTPLCTQVWANA